jgi:hypothetical protein
VWKKMEIAPSVLPEIVVGLIVKIPMAVA